MSQPSTAPLPQLFPPCARISAEPLEDFTAASCHDSVSVKLENPGSRGQVTRSSICFYNRTWIYGFSKVSHLPLRVFWHLYLRFLQAASANLKHQRKGFIQQDLTGITPTCAPLPPAERSAFPSAPLELTGLSDGSVVAALGGHAGWA